MTNPERVYELRQKIVVLGSGAVGKTTLIAAMDGGVELNEAYVPTVLDMVYKVASFTRNGKSYRVAVELMDSAFQEFSQDFLNIILRGTTCVIACYSVVHEYSQSDLKHIWVPRIKKFQQDIPILFCGTKLDLKETNAADYTPIKKMQELIEVKDSNSIVECSAHDFFYRHGEFEGCISEVFNRALRIGLKYAMKEKAPSKCVLI